MSHCDRVEKKETHMTASAGATTGLFGGVEVRNKNPLFMTATLLKTRLIKLLAADFITCQNDDNRSAVSKVTLDNPIYLGCCTHSDSLYGLARRPSRYPPVTFSMCSLSRFRHLRSR